MRRPVQAMNYYNENDPSAASWLAELVNMGEIPDGIIDTRSIVDVRAEDLRDFTQCHFFAGIGGWPLALRIAGWPANRPVWSGSPPCQPFSQAGQQRGVEDKRHLAPHFLDLVEAVRPPVVFGEQVAAAVGKDAWLDDLLDALEGQDYATGAAVLPACGVGAPHIRQRIWFVGRLADSAREQHDRAGHAGQGGRGEPSDGGENGSAGHWGDCTWITCSDGKARPTHPGIFPLAHGLPKGVVPSGDSGDSTQDARVMRLRGYGNAIVPALAAEVIKTIMDE